MIETATCASGRALTAVLAVCLLALPRGAAAEPWVETVIDEAAVPEVYGTAADVIELADARALLLMLTNESRRQAGIGELAAQDTADQVAQDHAAEMALFRYSNHYNLAGQKCELRFNIAGGTDHVKENTIYYETVPAVRLTSQLVRRMHEHWLQSDSHRANILDPAHTHLGSGFALEHEDGRTFAAGVVEFVNDYGDYPQLPASAHREESVTVRGRIDPERAVLRFIGVGVDYLPEPRDVEYQRAHTGGYRSPRVVLALLPRRYLGTYVPEAEYRRYTVDYDTGSGEFSAMLRFEPNWPVAAYYVTAWVSLRDHLPESGWDPLAGSCEEVFCVMTQVVLVE